MCIAVSQPTHYNPQRTITFQTLAMASLTHQYTYPIRPMPVRPNHVRTSSKEFQWTSAYDHVFNQYIEPQGTCNPAALAYPDGAIANEPSPIVSSVYPEPTNQQNRLWSANSFDAKDIHQPSPTFSPWMGNDSGVDLNISTSFEPIAGVTSHQNDLSMSGLRISYDPTLAPSHAQEMADEMYITTEVRRSRRESRTPSPSYRRQRTPSSGTPSPRRRQRRTPSSKGHSRKSSGQLQSPRGKSGSFVNYTPSDSEKLLTGVAPSGSSKTKARREREAVEKRRRFSQAALRAVVKAGGDLAELQDAGLVMG